MGPTPEISINDFKYYVSFVDDLTKYTWIFPIARKSDVTNVFKHFKPLIENQFSPPIPSMSNESVMSSMPTINSSKTDESYLNSDPNTETEVGINPPNINPNAHPMQNKKKI